ncbi:MAG: KamA family radical SAM protein [Phycisphaeraceae bacterium]|nr:KamA family radical SAM protein [Phycisphaeraceae bacterium]
MSDVSHLRDVSSFHTEKDIAVVDDEPPSPVPPDLSQHAADWTDWRWQMQQRIRTVKQLLNRFPAVAQASDLNPVIGKYPLAITPYYASLIQKTDTSDPIFQMCVPQMQELIDPPFLSPDPLEECHDMPVPGLVHRYPDRALLIATTQCAMYCRHCTRKRVAGTRETSISRQRLNQAVAYLKGHSEIHDVIISGGDPLTMATERLEIILAALREVPSLQIIRIGTRVPVVLPQRVNDELCSMLRRYHPVWINTHFNHPQEITPESRAACTRLADAGIPLGNQAVLLRGVNDRPQVVEQLCRELVALRVRPYYLYQCDLVRGVEHFRTPLSRGLEIMEYLRGRLSGLAIPTFVVDAPHGGGKIPVLPTYLISQSPTHAVLRNCEGMLIAYPEPQSRMPELADMPLTTSAPSVWDLAGGHYSHIQPEQTLRQERRRTCCGWKPQSEVYE